MFGVPTTIEFSFLVVLAILGWAPMLPARYSIAWIVIVIVAVLVHEMGHALAFKVCGGHPTIRLRYMFGLTNIGSRQLSWGEKVFVTAAGPLAGFALGLLVIVIGGSPSPFIDPWSYYLVRASWWVTIGWGLINLLPIFPADGGQIFLALLEGAQVRTARRIVYLTSIVVAAVGIVIAVVHEMQFLAFMAAGFAYLNIKLMRTDNETEWANGAAELSSSS